MVQKIHLERFVFITSLLCMLFCVSEDRKKNIMFSCERMMRGGEGGKKYWNGKGCCFHVKNRHVLPCTLGFQIANLVMCCHNLCVTDWLQSLLIYMER